MWKIELRPDLILGLWIEVVSEAAELMRKISGIKRYFLLQPEAKCLVNCEILTKLPHHNSIKKGALLALLTLYRKYLLQGPRTCIFCPGTLFYEQYDTPQLSLASKYGHGHVK